MPATDPTLNPAVGDTSIAPLAVAALTGETLAGAGIFDVLMRANKAHLEDQFNKSRIKGPEYSTVYLGSLEAVLTASIQFLLQQGKAALEAELLRQQVANAILEAKVLVAQECKLRAEYDVLMETKLKTAQETQLLTWKVTTEKAQTSSLGVDADSVIGKQKLLYTKQADGFVRDAEQKATKIMVDSWNVRRTTDEATVADGTNNLNDVAIGRAVTKLLAGISA